MSKEKLRSSPQSRRHFMKWGIRSVVGLVSIGGISTAVMAYKRHYETLHDLSVVGNGIATVVQVHDVNCRYCQQLRSNVRSVAPKFDEKDLQIRIADIQTIKGAAFASQHESEHVTLLMFDQRGRLTQKLKGVTSEEDIERAFRRLISSGS
jgi:hypothetical protein